MFFYAAATVALLAGKAAAVPALYNAKAICEIPSQGFKGHSGVVENSDVSFTITDLDDETVSTFMYGMQYKITVPSFTTGPANMWLHASAGEVEPSDTETHSQADVCVQSAFSTAPQEEHVLLWTAPTSAVDCVTISAAQANSPTTPYQTNSVEICGMTAGMMPAGAPGPADAPVAMAPVVDAPVDDDDDTVRAPAPAPGPTPSSAAGIVATGAIAAFAAVALF